MNKKKIIQIIFIILCFGGSIYVVYNGIFKNNGMGSTLVDLVAQPTSTTQNPPAEMLPYGKELDFQKVFGKRNLQFGLSNFEKLDPSEVGKDNPNQLIEVKKKQ